MHAALATRSKEARDPGVRAVVITGAGRGFCAGQDLGEFSDDMPNVGDSLRATYHPNVLAIRALEKPVIAGVNGAVRRRRHSRSRARATCASPRTRPPSSPASSASASFPTRAARIFIDRLLGPARAFEWMTSNRRLTAAEAHAWGLVSEVIEADAFASAHGRARGRVRGDADARRSR